MKKDLPPLSNEVLNGLYRSEHRPSHDQKWAELEAEDAALARHAMLEAEAIRQEELDPGDAYLQGMADAITFVRRNQLIDNLRHFDPNAELADL